MTTLSDGFTRLISFFLSLKEALIRKKYFLTALRNVFSMVLICKSRGPKMSCLNDGACQNTS